MSYVVTRAAANALSNAVRAFAAPLHPDVAVEMLDTPEGSALHIKLTVDRLRSEDQRRELLRKTGEAVVASFPGIMDLPHVTIFQRA